MYARERERCATLLRIHIQRFDEKLHATINHTANLFNRSQLRHIQKEKAT